MKSKKIYIIFLIVIVLFAAVLVDRKMQNDTFFYIAIGERLAETHTIDGLDHWSFHEGLRFTYPRLDS